MKVNYTQCSVTCGSGYQDVLYKCSGDFGTCSYSGNVFYLGDMNWMHWMKYVIKMFHVVSWKYSFSFFVRIQKFHPNVFLERCIPIVSE